MKTKFSILLILFTLLFQAQSNAEKLSQTIRGSVKDKNIHVSLPGASIIIVGAEPFQGASTDADGNFRIENVALGRQTLKVNFLGYKEVILSNIDVTSGKELVLNIELEESVIMMKEAVISVNNQRDVPLNEMTVVSTKSISAEESQKYAAAFNDPGRTVSSVAGVTTTSDGNNNISIRGNSPNGILWRMEGVDIPSPNHFAQIGTSGGGISIISSQLLNNFDFMTGAFPAEYGNALSGVFDLKLRKGNNEKRENTFQAGFLGVDLSAEGPFKKDYNGSYLVNYRYSTLGLFSKLGVDVGDGVTTFQDLSFNVSLPTKKFGNFELFGFGGLSSDKVEAKKDSSKFDYEYKRYSDNYFSNTGAIGLTHSLILGSNSYIKTSFVSSTTQVDFEEKRLNNELNHELVGDMKNHQTTQNLSSVLNHRFNPKLSIRTGFTLTNNRYDLNLILQNDTTKVLEQQLDANDNMQSAQAFVQAQYKFTDDLTLNIGAHEMYSFLNKKQTIEPRMSVKWEFLKHNSISLGYGLHSQMQTTSIYFNQFEDANGNFVQQNKNLDFSKAHHFVLGYDHMFSDELHLKTELYYQDLFNIPVYANESSSFSMVNNTSPVVYEVLENKGTGRNYGAEITVEKFLKNGYYGVLTTSIFDSKYKGSDGVERNTRFNGHVTSTLTVGKEFKISDRRTLGLNLKTIYAGGNWDTPIDFEKSKQYATTYYKENEAFSVQNPAYFRSDLKISLQTNKSKSTRTLSLDIQNVSNQRNVGQKRYDAERNEVITSYQMSLLPILSYKINF